MNILPHGRKPFRHQSEGFFFGDRRAQKRKGETMQRDSVAIIGAGKVGTATGYLLRLKGYPVVALADISENALARALEYTGGRACASAAEAAALADAVFITTTDDIIAPVCLEIAGQGVLGPGKRVIHMSGAGGLDLLEPARKAGASTATIHPLQSFVDVAAVIKNIPGSTFAITAQDDIRDWAVQVVADLGGIPFFVEDADKPLYHAAACVASNYLVSLMHIVTSLYGILGFTPDDAIRAFWPLVRGTISNMEARGIAGALTGPVARGDLRTIEKHLAVLEAKAPQFLTLYRELGRVAVGIARNMETISEEKGKELDSLLKGEGNHE